MIDKKEVLEKEIDLIQSCITRMAQNSFMVKGWCLTLLAAVLALLPEKIDTRILCLLGIAITACFWYLDAFFLKTERLYRWKYEWVIKNRMNSEKHFYDLNPYNPKMWCLDKNGKKKEAPCIIRIMFTKTLMPIYLSLIIVALTVFVVKFFV